MSVAPSPPRSSAALASPLRWHEMAARSLAGEVLSRDDARAVLESCDD